MAAGLKASGEHVNIAEHIAAPSVLNFFKLSPQIVLTFAHLTFSYCIATWENDAR